MELENLDALLQRMSARVTHVVAGHLANAGKDENGNDLPIELPTELRIFTELPPEFGFTQLKAARAELETVVARRNELESLEGV